MPEPAPNADRLLLAAAKAVLDCREFLRPALNAYVVETGHQHPLAGALLDLRTAVAACEGRL